MLIWPISIVKSAWKELILIKTRGISRPEKRLTKHHIAERYGHENSSVSKRSGSSL